MTVVTRPTYIYCVRCCRAWKKRKRRGDGLCPKCDRYIRNSLDVQRADDLYYGGLRERMAGADTTDAMAAVVEYMAASASISKGKGNKGEQRYEDGLKRLLHWWADAIDSVHPLTRFRAIALVIQIAAAVEISKSSEVPPEKYIRGLPLATLLPILKEMIAEGSLSLDMIDPPPTG